MKTIAILNEKGGTAKTTTSVNLAASLGEMGKKVLLVDLDGQAASSRWLGVEGDTRLADALLRGSGLVPIDDVIPGVSLAPASGKLDSISHNLRPTQGSQLRRVLAEVKDRYDYILIDCPPSLGNRLIGNALLAASHAIVPVETSILALDGLRILLTMLDDIRQGFEHDIELIGALGCRFNSRTRLSRLVLAELHRALPGKVFGTVIHETVRMQECPASGKSILEYAPACSAAEDYRTLAGELVHGMAPCTIETGFADLVACEDVDESDRQKVSDFRKRAQTVFRRPIPDTDEVDEPCGFEDGAEIEDPQLKRSSESSSKQETPREPSVSVRSVDITLTAESSGQDETPPQTAPDTPEEDVEQAPEPSPEPIKTVSCGEKPHKQNTDAGMKDHKPPRNRDNVMVGVAATILVGILSIGGWVGFKALAPAPETASAKPASVAITVDRNTLPPKVDTAGVTPPKIDSGRVEPVAIDPENKDASSENTRVEDVAEPKPAVRKEIVILASEDKSGGDDKNATGKQPDDKSSASRPDKTARSSTDKPLVASAAKSKAAAKSPTTQPKGKTPTTQPASKAPRQARAEDYPSGLTLTGVMYGKTSRRAIIGDSVVYEGDTVKGAKVVKILPDSVEIEANGFRFLLGTGPKPVWLKATQVLATKDKTPDKAPTDGDSKE
ncbi:MAG: AAA family ATPase [Phycisphaerae bacterium]|jgi:chromosome partitioning protein|nr:AAA family ATPase [Phycisphaerae bacterium]